MLEQDGLTSEEVEARVAAGQVNLAPGSTGRSAWDIVRSNIFTWFNLILGALFVLMVTLGSWRDSLFGIVIVVNAVIGIAQEMRAKIALDRLALLTAPVARVIRDGREQDIATTEVVLGDVLLLAAGDQVVADGDTLDSQGLEVDESLLTGESVPVVKRPGDRLLSGSLGVAGGGTRRATAVGAEAYAQRVVGEGRRYSRTHSDLVYGINRILRVVGVMILPVGGLLVWSQYHSATSLAEGVTSVVAALVAMVPQGLVLLCSIAFAVSAVKLARRNVLTRELQAVEGLARVDVLCIDKTGTITEPHPAFERFEPAGEADGSEALQALGAVAAAQSGSNATLDAIRAGVPAPESWHPDSAVPFSSARKWSAASFAGRGSWVLGAPEIVGEDEGSALSRQHAAELSGTGLRVLLLSHTTEPIPDDALPPHLVPAGLVVLSEKVRADARQTLDYFTQQGVSIKVISGDTPVTVQTVAARAGVPGAENAVDARTLPEGDALTSAMERTSVFGRVTPEQKRSMVAALQSGGHTVAMTGDGVNDVLALKKADLGVAMGTGTAAARAVAQIILVDSRFETLPSVVAEGRRVTANIERVANMFATKTVWAAILALAVALVGLPYPMLPRQLTLVDTAAIGIPAFFLALAPNPRRYVPGFVGRVARFVLPTGLLAAVVVFASYLLVRRLGASVAEARAMETAIFALVGLRVVSLIERPLRGWRLGLVLTMACLVTLAYVVPVTRSFLALNLGDWREIVATAAMGVVAWFLLALGWRVGERVWPTSGEGPRWAKSIRRKLPGREAHAAPRSGSRG